MILAHARVERTRTIERTRSMAPTTDTRLAGTTLRAHSGRWRQDVSNSGLRPTTPEDMDTCPEVQRRMMMMALNSRASCTHKISSFVHMPPPSPHGVDTPAPSNEGGDEQPPSKPTFLSAIHSDEQSTSKPTFLSTIRHLSTLPSDHVAFFDVEAPSRSASAPDFATAPARRQRCFAPVRTSRPPALVELERPGSRKLALRKDEKARLETARRQSSFMQHTYTSKRDLQLMLTFKKEQLSRRGLAPG